MSTDHPLHSFKTQRLATVAELTAPQRAADKALIADCMKKVQDHAGRDLQGIFTVRILERTPPKILIECKDHIPIEVEFEPALAFHVRRHWEKRKHDRLDDALIFGEPYKSKQPRHPVLFSFDTTPVPQTPTTKDL